MSDNTKIEWTDSTWSPITGCSVVSAGCKNCYAMKLAGTRLQHHPSRAGLTVDTNNGPVWTGEVRFNEQWLDQPMRWKKPRMIFVCAHSDLFHESVPDEWLPQVFGIMAAAKQHTFQVLTKRPERMRAVMNDGIFFEAVACEAKQHGVELTADQWPLPNVWLGVSIEDQAAADERIPLLLDTPAAVRWISAEPLLGLVDLTRVSPAIFAARANALTGNWKWEGGPTKRETPALDWVVVGGESGQKARPMHPDWARSLRDQCAAAGVPFLFKQWGEWLPMCQQERSKEFPEIVADGANGCPKNGWPSSHVHYWGDVTDSYRVGKKAAGRLLDGVQHDGYPEGGAA